MTDEPALQRPIGWWVREADAGLNQAFDRCLRDRQLDRRGWQVLASLSRQPCSRADLAAALASFDPPAAIAEVVSNLIERDWVEESGGLLLLTAVGRVEQAALTPLVEEVRRQVAAVLPPADYRTLVHLLERLINGLATAASD